MLRRPLLGILIVALPLLALLASNYHLLFTVPPIKQVQMPQLNLVYLDHTGTYQKAGTYIVDVYQMAAQQGIQCREYLGQFFHTFAVPENQRYARFACVVDVFPPQLPAPYRTAIIPAQSYIMLTRKEQGPLVNYIMDQHLQRHAREHNLQLADYFIELYTPPRVARGTAEMLRPIKAD